MRLQRAVPPARPRGARKTTLEQGEIESADGRICSTDRELTGRIGGSRRRGARVAAMAVGGSPVRAVGGGE